MSVVAWDGKFLAADRQLVRGEMKFPVTKIRRIKTGEVLAWLGFQDYGLAMVTWYDEKLRDPKQWPEFQKGDDYAILVVAKKDGSGKPVVHYYGLTPEPMLVESNYMAWGSGHDVAMAALSLGKSAGEAVKLCTELNIYCGLGVDEIEV